MVFKYLSEARLKYTDVSEGAYDSMGLVFIYFIDKLICDSKGTIIMKIRKIAICWSHIPELNLVC